MSTFQLFPTAIKAALTCADANHPGKALQGVFVEFHPTETLYVATNGFPGYFAIHKTGEGERSKLPNRIKATCFCMGVTGAEAMHRDAVSYGSYFPDAQ